MRWYIKVIKSYASFNGRARRQEYWMFTLFNFIFIICAYILDWVMGTKFQQGSLISVFAGGVVSGIYQLFIFIPGIAVSIRRLHDTGKSGALAIAMIVTSYAIGLYAHFALDQEALRHGNFAGSGILGVLLAFLVILGLAIWMLVLLCMDSTPGINAYGPNPKETQTFSFNE